MSVTIDAKAQLLKNLVNRFYKGNSNFCLMVDEIEKMDWDFQHSFLQATVKSKLVNEYPVSSQFIKIFLKKIVDYLEPIHEIHDDLYEELCKAMKATSQDTFCYRHYIVGHNLDKIITMRETRNMVVNGTTGLKTWEAALMLSDWALSNKDIFANKDVLELGSGVGFAGITIGKMCDVKSMLLTDCHDEVLKTICDNIEINCTEFERNADMSFSLYEHNSKSIGVMKLDWNMEHVHVDIKPDILIGADIVYDPAILQPLCNVLKAFSLKNKCLEVFIASVVRNETTFQEFLKTLDEMDFHHEVIEMKEFTFIEWDKTVHKCLLKIII